MKVSLSACGILALAAVLASPTPTRAQFRAGLLKKTTEVTLTRKRPPKVLITGAAVRVEVVSQTHSRDNVAVRFKSTIETRLLANDSRLRVEQAEPDTLILCTINRLDTKQTAGQRTVKVSKQIGTKQVWNEKKKVNETQAVYGLVDETRSFTTVQGDMSISVQVRDRRTGAPIDSQVFSPSYTEEFAAGTTPPDEGRVEQSLMDRGAAEFVSRVTTTQEPIRVMLARTSEIDKLNDLGAAGLWNRMLEQLEQIPPFPKPDKEAYRLYNLGVASEALAYGADDIGMAKKFLEQASSLYGQALERKPDEEYFRSPQMRVAEGLAAYSTLERQQAIIAAAAANPTPVNARPAESPASGPSGARDLSAPKTPAEPQGFRNKDVIALVAAGIDDANLITAINEEKIVDFDLSPAGQLELLKGKVSNKVLAVMRARLKKKAPAY